MFLTIGDRLRRLISIGEMNFDCRTRGTARRGDTVAALDGLLIVLIAAARRHDLAPFDCAVVAPEHVHFTVGAFDPHQRGAVRTTARTRRFGRALLPGSPAWTGQCIRNYTAPYMTRRPVPLIGGQAPFNADRRLLVGADGGGESAQGRRRRIVLAASAVGAAPFDAGDGRQDSMPACGARGLGIGLDQFACGATNVVSSGSRRTLRRQVQHALESIEQRRRVSPSAFSCVGRNVVMSRRAGSPGIVRAAPEHPFAVITNDVAGAERQVRRRGLPRDRVTTHAVRDVREPAAYSCQPHCGNWAGSVASARVMRPAATSIWAIVAGL